MLARLGIGKLHVSAALAVVSLVGLGCVHYSSGKSTTAVELVAPLPQPPQQAYKAVQERQHAREQELASPQATSGPAQTLATNAPRRLDLLQGASGQPIDARSIFSLSSPIGDGFGKLVPVKNGYGLEVKEPGRPWSRLPEVHFDKSLVLMRHGRDCVRLEDPAEPTANYYAICMKPDGITIHTVGELKSFS